MKKILFLNFLCASVTFAQNQYPENVGPDNMQSGIYFQAGPGANNTTLNWAYPYGTKLTVKADPYRNFELMTSHYPYGNLSIRQWDPSNSNWTDWRNLIVQDFNGNYGVGTLQAQAFFEINKSINNFWTTKITNSGGESLGLLVKNGYGGSQSSNEGVIMQLEDGSGNVRMKVQSNGKVGIGTSTPDSQLAVNGVIHSKEVKVDLTGWADYVFDKDYDLPTLEEVADHIREKGHLINIPSAVEVEANGIDLGKMNRLLLEKIEELTLYIIEQNKLNNSLTKRIEKLEKNK